MVFEGVFGSGMRLRLNVISQAMVFEGVFGSGMRLRLKQLRLKQLWTFFQIF
jgi:hypothetical protein